MIPQPAQRGGKAKSSTQCASLLNVDWLCISPLVGPPRAPHKRRVAQPLFDMELRALRRDRASRSGPELFLHERAFDDCLDRLALIQRKFQSALLIGCPDAGWRHRLGDYADSVEIIEPGPLFAHAAAAQCVVEDQFEPRIKAFALCVAVGTLDAVNDLPRALKSIRASLKDDCLFIGALAGGEGLPQLRRAMHAADQVAGAAAPRIHPRIEAASLAALLSACGFIKPVVDVDRVQVSYESLDRLVRDLRGMAATNILLARSPKPLSRSAKAAAAQAFRSAGDGSRTVETFELLHFAAWTPPI
jgi:NADH dehydrogenase [ubiquinone] 1 alpha subcomplex assembly factor 5